MLLDEITFGTISNECLELEFSNPKHSFCIESKDSRGSVESFKSALFQANIIDALNTDFYGSYVVLPNGLKLFQMFFDIVTQLYQDFGLIEFDFPMVTSPLAFTKSKNILDLTDKLLHIGNDKSFAEGNPIATLTPTGEQIIYSYWQKIVKKETDLPIKLFKKSKFLRPISKNKTKSIFKSLETSDVFEFHCAYSNKDIQEDELNKAIEMFNNIYRLTYVPIIQVQRPIWTNNYNISDATIGFDVLLPNLKTLQVGSIYDQNQIFSKVYDIQFERNNEKHYTVQMTGALSRRLILSHLYLGLKTNNTLTIHPKLSPIQVEIKCVEEVIENKELNEVFNVLDNLNIRYVYENTISKKTTITPLTILVFPKRTQEDKYKIVFIRNDYESEYCIFSNNLIVICDYVNKILNSIGNDFVERQKIFYERNICFASSLEEISLKQKQFPIIKIAISFDKETVELIEKQIKGEILGFYKNNIINTCALTGRTTNYIALISKRI